MEFSELADLYAHLESNAADYRYDHQIANLFQKLRDLKLSLGLGWFEKAAKSFSEYLKIHPSDIDGRFFLASASSLPNSFLLSTTIPLVRSSLRMGQFSMIVRDEE